VKGSLIVDAFVSRRDLPDARRALPLRVTVEADALDTAPDPDDAAKPGQQLGGGSTSRRST